MKTKLTIPLLGLLVMISSVAHSASLGTTFTYQGRLASGAAAPTGLYDFQFSLWDAASGGAQAGGTLDRVATGVTNGLFTVTLDFGAGAFNGGGRWLEIGVRTNGSPADFSPLLPRQALTPAPYALYAPSAGVANTATTAGTATTASVANSVASGQVVRSLNALKDDVTLNAGANVTLTPSGQTLTLASPADWHVGGNAGTMPGTSFLGTTDNQPLELWGNNQRALRLEPRASGPNFIGGATNNVIQGGAYADTIGGGTWHWNDAGLQHLTRDIESSWKSNSGTPEDDQKLWAQKRREATAELSKPQMGFIAQEVEQVYPDWVKTDEQGYRQVNMEHVNAVLVNAVKEQQAEIETLRSRLERLEYLLARQSGGGQ